MHEIPIKHTARGFALGEFTDRNGKACSIQKSSIADEDCIWLGCDEIGLIELIPGQGWTPVAMPTHVHQANTRMHLNQEQVKALLPLLKRFVRKGEL